MQRKTDLTTEASELKKFLTIAKTRTSETPKSLTFRDFALSRSAAQRRPHAMSRLR